jgi:hypothetical protein
MHSPTTIIGLVPRQYSPSHGGIHTAELRIRRNGMREALSEIA